MQGYDISCAESQAEGAASDRILCLDFGDLADAVAGQLWRHDPQRAEDTLVEGGTDRY